MTTRTYRNHYGLIVESVYEDTLFTTMRRYNRDTVTSMSTIDKDDGFTRVSYPENISHTHIFSGVLTKKRIESLHKEGIKEIVKRLANIV